MLPITAVFLNFICMSDLRDRFRIELVHFQSRIVFLFNENALAYGKSDSRVNQTLVIYFHL